MAGPTNGIAWAALAAASKPCAAFSITVDILSKTLEATSKALEKPLNIVSFALKNIFLILAKF